MAEGAPLLRAYTLTRIEGSNPFLSASLYCFRSRKSLNNKKNLLILLCLYPCSCANFHVAGLIGFVPALKTS